MQLAYGAILAYDCERVAIVLPSYDYSESQYPEAIVAHHASGLDATPVKPGIEYVPERTCTLEVNFDASNVECSECHYPMPLHINLMEIHYCPSCGAKVVDE